MGTGGGYIVPPDFYDEAPSKSFLFYENLGQVIKSDSSLASEIYYYSSGSSLNLFLGNSVSFTTLSLDTSSNSLDTLRRLDMSPYSDGGLYPQPVSDESTAFYHNYFLPHCPNGITNVAGSQRIVYQDYFSGIDFHVYSNQLGPKFYFVINPGAELSSLKLTFTGQDSLQISPNLLEFYLSTHEIRLPEAIAYQLSPTNQIITLNNPVIYDDQGSGVVGFDVGSYDNSKPLVIQIGLVTQPFSPPNPLGNLCWSTYYGGTNVDEVYLVETDNIGNVIIGGRSGSPNLPLITGSLIQQNMAGYGDIFITKFNYLAEPQWGTFYGGSLTEYPMDMSINSNNDVFITGHTGSIDLPQFNPLVFNSTQGAGFLAGFSSNGFPLIGTYIAGTNGQSIATGVDINSADHIFVVGRTEATDFPTQSKSNAYNQTQLSVPIDPLYGVDGFLLEIDNQNQLVWSTYFGGGSIDEFHSINITANDHIMVSGITYSDSPASNDPNNPTCGVPDNNQDFPDCHPTGSYTQDIEGQSDAIIVEFGENGQLLWSTYFGDDGMEDGTIFSIDLHYFHKIISDPLEPNVVYLLGRTETPINPPFSNNTGIQGSYHWLPTSSGVYYYLAKFDQRALQWVTILGSDQCGSAFIDFTMDYAHNLYISGGTTCLNTIFLCSPPTLPGTFPSCGPQAYYGQIVGSTVQGIQDAFIWRINQNNQLDWAAFYGGSGLTPLGNMDAEFGNGLAFDPLYHSLYMVGETNMDIPNTIPLVEDDINSSMDYIQFSSGTSPGIDANSGFITRFCLPETTTTNIEEKSYAEQVKIYPNPTNDFLLVEIPEFIQPIDLWLINTLGQEVLETKLISPYERINLSKIASGVYIVRIGSKAYTKIIIK